MSKKCTYFITEPESINELEFKKVDFTVIGDDSLKPAYKLTKQYSMTNGIITKRAEVIRSNELLYDHEGNPVAIKSNGKILPIIEGDL